jgi:hypothetical protein
MPSGIKEPSVYSREFANAVFFLQIGRKREPTSGLEPLTCSLRVITQALQGIAGVCKSRIFKGGSFPCLAPRYTVLRSRWYQSGINSGNSCFTILPIEGART